MHGFKITLLHVHIWFATFEFLLCDLSFTAIDLPAIDRWWCHFEPLPRWCRWSLAIHFSQSDPWELRDWGHFLPIYNGRSLCPPRSNYPLRHGDSLKARRQRNYRFPVLCVCLDRCSSMKLLRVSKKFNETFILAWFLAYQVIEKHHPDA